MTRPRRLASVDFDPLQLAAAALHELDVVRLSLRANAAARQRLDDVQETLRRLAWGPDD
jgi:hypothetical protein